jgi:hypothetical protein
MKMVSGGTKRQCDRALLSPAQAMTAGAAAAAAIESAGVT